MLLLYYWASGAPCVSPIGGPVAELCSVAARKRQIVVARKTCRPTPGRTTMKRLTEYRTLHGHDAEITGLAFTPDSRRIYTAGDDRTVRVWDVTSGKQIGDPWQHDGYIWDIALSPDGRVLAVAVAGDGCILETLGGDGYGASERRLLQTDSVSVHALAFSPDGALLAGGCYDGDVRVWHVGTAQESRCLKGHFDPVNAVTFSPDGRLLMSGSNDRTVRIWRVADGEETLCMTGQDGDVCAVAFLPDGQSVLIGGDDFVIRHCCPRTGRELGRLEGHDERCAAFALSPDGRRLMVGHGAWYAALWDLGSRSRIRDFPRHEGYCVRPVAFSPDGRTVATASDLTCAPAWLWDVEGGPGRPLRGHEGSACAVTWIPETDFVVSGGSDGRICVWNARDGQQIRAFYAADSAIRGLAAAPDARHIFTCAYDRAVRCWAIDSKREVWSHQRDDNCHINDVACTPDGRIVLSGCDDGFAHVRSGDDGSEIAVLGPLEGPAKIGITSVALSHDGQLALLGGFEVATLVRISDGRTLQRFQGHYGWTPMVNCVAFTPDEKRVVTGGSDGTVRMWDAATGQEHWRYADREGSVAAVALTGNGKTILASLVDRIQFLSAVAGSEQGHLSLKSPGSIALSSSGEYLATCSAPPDALRIWRYAT